MLIAVATKSGSEVDQHFGHAEKFLIYDFNRGQPMKVGEVAVEKYCSFDPDHPLRTDQLNAICEALKDCRAVVTAQIGDYPRAELEKAGLVHVAADGPIVPALQVAHERACGCSCRGTCGG